MCIPTRNRSDGSARGWKRTVGAKERMIRETPHCRRPPLGASFGGGRANDASRAGLSWWLDRIASGVALPCDPGGSFPWFSHPQIFKLTPTFIGFVKLFFTCRTTTIILLVVYVLRGVSSQSYTCCVGRSVLVVVRNCTCELYYYCAARSCCAVVLIFALHHYTLYFCEQKYNLVYFGIHL
jgi:hypothetical protein